VVHLSVKWYVVKTLYRSYAEGRPEKPDLSYDPDLTLVEERALLIRATDSKEALRKAEKDAEDFCKRAECYNPYQQRVVTKYTGFYDISEAGESLSDKQEIFTQSRLVSVRVSDQKAAQLFIGTRVKEYGKGKRRKFANRDFSLDSVKGTNS